MEPSLVPSIVYPPNKPMDKMQPQSSTYSGRPDNFTFIDINSKGELIVGASDITSSWWYGQLHHYKNLEDAKEHLAANSYVDESTVADGKFVDDESVILAADTGRLTLLNLSEECGDNSELKVKDFYYNSYRIIQMDVWKSTKKMLSCSGNSVNLWNLQSGIVPIHEYRNYHTDKVVTVSSCTHDENMFVSGSWDKRVCVWDVRLDIQAMVINKMDMGPIMAVSYRLPSSDNFVLMGTISGHICSIDTRNPKEFLDKYKLFDRRIHKLKVNPKNGEVAGCADAPKVKVSECNNTGEFRFMYQSNAHSQFPRGLAWYENQLYSCGFDGKIIEHIV